MRLIGLAAVLAIARVLEDAGRPSRHSMRLAVSLFAGLALAGCGETVKQYVSVPDRVPIGVSGRLSGDLIQLALEDVNVSVQMQNYWSENLGVWLSLEAKGEGFSFDPGLVVLKTDSGESLTPAEFLGPDTPWQSPRAFGMGCGPRRYSLGYAPSKIDVTKAVILRGAGARPFSGLSCFMLWFHTNPSPDRTLILSLGGISKGGRAIIVPDLSFKKGLVERYLIALGAGSFQEKL